MFKALYEGCSQLLKPEDLFCLVSLKDQILKTVHAFLLFLAKLKYYQQILEHFFTLVCEEQKYYFLEFTYQLSIFKCQFLNKKLIYLN